MGMIVTGSAWVWGEAPDAERHRREVRDELQLWFRSGLVEGMCCQVTGDSGCRPGEFKRLAPPGLAALRLWPLLAGRDSFRPGDADYLHCLLIALTFCRRSGWRGHNKSW